MNRCMACWHKYEPRSDELADKLCCPECVAHFDAIVEENRRKDDAQAEGNDRGWRR